MTTDAVIIGGGAIGLSIAYLLTGEGVRTTVLDRAELGKAASWAGAGIISPPSTKETRDPLTALRTLSALAHPVWSAKLLEETGIDNGYRPCGGLDVALSEADEVELEISTRLWAEEGVEFQRLEGDEIRRTEPTLSPSIRTACELPGRAQIRNPRHLKALAEAIQQRGGQLRPGLPALGFETNRERITAVETSEGPIPCAWAIIAAGPWSEGLLISLGINAPTPPVKGQIVLLKQSRTTLTRIIEHGHDYLVPRDDGRILVGATEEDAGFDSTPTARGARDLLAEAILLCPDLANAEVEKTWAGLRPGSRDGRPLIGPVPGWSNLLVASGHRRAGLQLSPGTAIVIADMIMDRKARFDLRELRPTREEGVARRSAFRS